MKKVLSLALVFGFISCGVIALGNVEARGRGTHEYPATQEEHQVGTLT